MTTHWIEKCEQGHIISQCRCIGPKTTRIVAAHECPVCVKNRMLEDKDERQT